MGLLTASAAALRSLLAIHSSRSLIRPSAPHSHCCLCTFSIAHTVCNGLWSKGFRWINICSCKSTLKYYDNSITSADLLKLNNSASSTFMYLWESCKVVLVLHNIVATHYTESEPTSVWLLGLRTILRRTLHPLKLSIPLWTFVWLLHAFDLLLLPTWKSQYQSRIVDCLGRLPSPQLSPAPLQYSRSLPFGRIYSLQLSE